MDAIENALSVARKPHSAKVHTGPINSAVAGRTDHLQMHLPSGSYVVPADVVNHYGEDNTLAGFEVLKSIFNTLDRTGGTPYGETGLPYGGPEPKASGGKTGGKGEVPIVGAGGEFVAGPDDIVGGLSRALNIHGLSLDDAHKILDQFVVQSRKRHIDTLKKLPGPRKD